MAREIGVRLQRIHRLKLVSGVEKPSVPATGSALASTVPEGQGSRANDGFNASKGLGAGSGLRASSLPDSSRGQLKKRWIAMTLGNAFDCMSP